MALSNKKSVLAIVKETTEGVPIKPSASTDYVALQEGFEVEPAFEELENAELTGSIGQAKSELGFESPTASLSHYLRHSGVEGQAPNYGDILESMMGSVTIKSPERDTIGGSTAGTASVRAQIKVDTGEGAEFKRGMALLIKDSPNSVRNINNISTDDLNLSFNLSSAPAAAINLGQAVLYEAADDGHPTLAFWLYRANGGAVELMAGTRVTEGTMNVTAGEFVNMDFSFEGIEYFFDGLLIDSTNKFMDFNDGGGEENVSVAEKMYKDPHELAAALQSAMDAATADNITVTYNDSDGKFTIASDGATLSLLWNTGTNTANTIGKSTALNFDVSADDTGSLTYTGDNAIDLTSPQTPAFDSADPLVAKDNEVFLGDFDDNVCFKASTITASITNTKTDILDVCAVSGKSGSLFTDREASIEVQAQLDQYDADKFRKFREGSVIEFQYNFGEKVGGDWVAGKVGNLYTPTATITSYQLVDNDGIIDLAMTLTPFVDSGLPEIYINFL